VSTESEAPDRADHRSAAIADLFDALEGLMIHYGALPDAERAARRAADADRITGEVARHLEVARRRIAASARP
jgi:hypothetical protein